MRKPKHRRTFEDAALRALLSFFDPVATDAWLLTLAPPAQLEVAEVPAGLLVPVLMMAKLADEAGTKLVTDYDELIHRTRAEGFPVPGNFLALEASIVCIHHVRLQERNVVLSNDKRSLVEDALVAYQS